LDREDVFDLKLAVVFFVEAVTFLLLFASLLVIQSHGQAFRVLEIFLLLFKFLVVDIIEFLPLIEVELRQCRVVQLTFI